MYTIMEVAENVFMQFHYEHSREKSCDLERKPWRKTQEKQLFFFHVPSLLSQCFFFSLKSIYGLIPFLYFRWRGLALRTHSRQRTWGSQGWGLGPRRQPSSKEVARETRRWLQRMSQYVNTLKTVEGPSLSAREITKRSESGVRAVTLQRNCRHECELKGVARPHEQVQGLGFQPHLMAPELELPGLCCTSLHPLVTSAGAWNQEGRPSPAQPQLESVVTQVFGHSACLQMTTKTPLWGRILS